MHLESRIYVAGHRGLVGSALVRALVKAGYKNILTRRRNELDLQNESAVRSFFMREKPEYVLLAAAKVGGILANNQYPVEFLVENLSIQNNIILAARDANVNKLLFLGSSCIYPKMSPQPIKEEYLLTGSLEPTNASYALAKIAGINLCQSCSREYGCNFISVMPTNLYGPNDNFDLDSSHVLPALIRKAYMAKMQNEPTITIWGTGTPRREFLHSDDLASACLFLMDTYDSPEIVNIGTGCDVTITELAQMIMETVEYTGELVFDKERPDGTPRKVLDVSRLTNLGWKPSIQLRDGIRELYEAVDKSTWINPSKI
jgi:GDP-L-fucose synthase